jgi:Neuraminidase (sialidase)
MPSRLIINHWDASLVALTNGDLLALETLDINDGDHTPDKIRAIRSTDEGQTWGTPQVIYDGPGEEQFPVGVQQPDGSIIVAFRNTEHMSGDPPRNTWAIDITKSFDNGSTWQPPSLFFDTSSSDLLTFIGKQTASNLTILGSSDFSGIWRLYVWQSGDGGNTWDGPYQISDSPYRDGGHFAVGCLGPIFTYGVAGSSNNWVAKRYNWTPTCQ